MVAIDFMRIKNFEKLASQRSNFLEAGFNLGFSGKKSENMLSEMTTSFQNQIEFINKSKKEEINNYEMLIRENQDKLHEIKEKGENKQIISYTFKPLIILYSIIFYVISWLLTHKIITYYINFEFHIMISLLCFNGIWTIVVFFFYKNNYVYEWVIKQRKLYRIINILITIFAFICFLRHFPNYVLFLILTCTTLLASLNLVPYISSSSSHTFDRAIEQKEIQINKLENLKNEAYAEMRNLINQIESKKTQALIDFYQGHIYGLSLNQKKNNA